MQARSRATSNHFLLQAMDIYQLDSNVSRYQANGGVTTYKAHVVPPKLYKMLSCCIWANPREYGEIQQIFCENNHIIPPGVWPDDNKNVPCHYSWDYHNTKPFIQVALVEFKKYNLDQRSSSQDLGSGPLSQDAYDYGLSLNLRNSSSIMNMDNWPSPSSQQYIYLSVIFE